MLQGIVKAQLEAPTPIQAQAIPILLAGRDTIAIARTGSGKTLAYVWPLLMHVLAQRRRPEGAGPAALVMAPTRELTEQIVVETKRFAKPLGLVCAGVYGGASKYQQSQWLKAGVDVVVGTPGRLIDMVKMKALVTGRLSFVVRTRLFADSPAPSQSLTSPPFFYLRSLAGAGRGGQNAGHGL